MNDYDHGLTHLLLMALLAEVTGDPIIEIGFVIVCVLYLVLLALRFIRWRLQRKLDAIEGDN